MPNLTMKVDAQLLKKARKIAIDNDTTLTGLIRKYLEDLVVKEEISIENAIAELEQCFTNNDVEIGINNWSREDLHER